MKDKVFSVSKKFLKHELIQGSSYLFLGTFAANILAFLFNLLVIRKLTYAQYGEYASLIALLTLLSIPSGSLVPVIVKFATEFLSKKEHEKAREFFNLSLKAILVFVGTFAVFFLFATPAITTFLHVQNVFLLLFIDAIIIIVYASIINTAFLQSIFRFDFLALTTIVGGIIRVVIGFLLLLAGLQLYGIFIALFLTFFIPYLLTFFPLKRILSYNSAHAKISIGEIFRYGLPTSISTLALSSLISTDVLLVKHFFSPTLAGIYAGLSLAGKTILYFTGPIPQVMFPLLVKRAAKGENTLTLFLFAGAIVILPSLFLTGLYALFPKLILTIFSGGKGYVSAYPYLGFFALLITLYSIVNILVTFLLSINMTKIVYILFTGAIAQILLISYFHNNFTQVIFSSTIITLVMLIALLLYYWKVYGTKKITSRFINNPSI